MINRDITSCADDAPGALRLLGWPRRSSMQARWIGRSEGLEKLKSRSRDDESLSICDTTRPSTPCGVTDDGGRRRVPLAQRAAEGNADLQAFLAERQRTGVTEAGARDDHSSAACRSACNGVLLITGRVRTDLGREFRADGATAPAQLCWCPRTAPAWRPGIRTPLRVAHPSGRAAARRQPAGHRDGCVHGARPADQFRALRRAQFDEACDAYEVFEAQGSGKRRVNYRLRDWGISRRYWGCPIPLIHCATCGRQPVPDEQLPFCCPRTSFRTEAATRSRKTAQFLACACPKCAAARPAPNGHDRHGVRGFVADPLFASAGTTARWSISVPRTGCPWTSTSAGSSTRSCTCWYSRFWTRVMRDLGLTKLDEPFTNLLTQGMVLNQIFFRKPASCSIVPKCRFFQGVLNNTVKLRFCVFPVKPRPINNIFINRLGKRIWPLEYHAYPSP